MYHFYNMKQSPSLVEIANSTPLEKLFYKASMEIEIEEGQQRM